MAAIIQNAEGRTISNSRSMRGLLDYARRKSPAVRAAVRETRLGGGELTVTYADGASGHAHFASYGVACSWVTACRSLGMDSREEVASGHEGARVTRFRPAA